MCIAWVHGSNGKTVLYFHKALLRCEEYFMSALFIHTLLCSRGPTRFHILSIKFVRVGPLDFATRATISSSADIIAGLTHGGLL